MLLSKTRTRRLYRLLFLAATSLLVYYYCSLSFDKLDQSQDDQPRTILAASNDPLRLDSSSQGAISRGSSHLSKVFVIGLSKTGTTSVGDALSRLSYHRIGWEDIRSRFLFRSYLKSDLSPLIALTRVYDAFEDLPWSLVYQDMARLYPDAKFILTLRKNEKDWLRSIKEHTAQRKWIGHDFVYGASHAAGHESSYLEAYRNHTRSVRNFFAREGNQTRLLEFVIDDWDGDDECKIWNVLLGFLEMEDTSDMRNQLGKFPWANRTDDWREKHLMKTIWWIWDSIMYYLEVGLLEVLKWSGWLTVTMA